MSTEGGFNTTQSRFFEEAYSDLSRKYEGKKSMLEEALIMYQELVSNVEAVKTEVTASKIERFKLEAARQQWQISVTVLEKSKSALKEEESRRDKAIKKLEQLLTAEYDNRDSADRGITKHVKDSAEDYLQYVKSCERNTVMEQLESLIAENDALNCEIDDLRKKASEISGMACSVNRFSRQDGGGICVTIQPNNSPSCVDDDTIEAIRQLRVHVEGEIKLAAEQNAKSEADLSRLKEKKETLENEINKMEDVWGK